MPGRTDWSGERMQKGPEILLGLCGHQRCFVRCQFQNGKDQMGLQLILPSKNNPFARSGVSEVSGGFTWGQFIISSLSLICLCNQNYTMIRAQEWQQSRASFLMASLGRINMTQFIHLQREQDGGISLWVSSSWSCCVTYPMQSTLSTTLNFHQTHQIWFAVHPYSQ